MFLMVKTQPDIAFVIVITTHFAENPSHVHTEAVKIIFCYLKRLINWRIMYGSEEKLFIKAYSNFDWANDIKSRKWTLGFIFMLNRGSIS